MKSIHHHLTDSTLLTPGLQKLPNTITLIRILLCPISAYVYLKGYSGVGFTLVILIGLTDFIDGWLARRLKAETILGSILDPLADKIFCATAFWVLYVQRLTPLWFLQIYLCVAVFQIAGYAWIFFARGQVQSAVQAHPISKWNMFLQCVWIAVLFLESWNPNLVPALFPVFWVYCFFALAQALVLAVYIHRYRHWWDHFTRTVFSWGQPTR